MTSTEALRLDNSNPEFERVQPFQEIKCQLDHGALIFSFEVDADATGGLTALTAPFPMVVSDAFWVTTVGETSNTIQILNGETQVCTALEATTAKAVSRMAAGVELDKLILNTGDTLSVKAVGGSNGDKQTGVITFIGFRV
mgnify:CR=1 FL=1